MRSILWLAAPLALVTVADARGCSVPVFRYALERWKPSAYVAQVIHRGPLSADKRQTAARLEDATRTANFRAERIDLADLPPAEAEALLKRHGRDGNTPFVAVAFPDADEDAPAAWVGPLDDTTLAGLLDSPARREVVKLLARGESAVWVLLLSGDRKADEDAEALLRRELARLRQAIELPEQPQEGSQLLTDLPLKVSFPLLRLDRDRPEEAALVRLLLRTEEVLATAKGPIVFPIFGRGRVLAGYEGETLTAKEIATAAKFLCGACSCRVKELNPGTDLLLAADWDALLEPSEVEPPPGPEKEPPVMSAPPIPPGLSDEPATTTSAEPRPQRSPWLRAVTTAAAALAIASGVWALRGRRARRSS